MGGTDDDELTLRLKVKDVEAFVADVKAGKLSVDDLKKSIVEADAAAKMSASDSGGGLGLLKKAARGVALVAAGTVLAVGGITAAAGVMGVKSAASTEQATIGFTTMLGSQAKAQQMMDKLSNFAIITPFQLDSLRQTASMMLGMGFSAKEIIPDLTSVGDAMSGLGRGADDVNGVTEALGQMKAHGVADAGDLLQLTSRGINAWQIMADKMGKSIPQIQKMVEKGLIPANDAIRMIIDGLESGTAHTQKFGGMMAKQADSLSGMWSNTVDAAQRATGALVTPLMPAMKGAIGGVNNWIPRAQNSIQAHGPALLDSLRSGNSFGIGVNADAMLGGSGTLTVPLMKLIDTGKNIATIWTGAVYPALKVALSPLGVLVPVLTHMDSITGYLAQHSGELRVTLIALVATVGTYKTLVFGINTYLRTEAAITGMLKVLKGEEVAVTNAQKVAYVAYQGALKVGTALQWAFAMSVKGVVAINSGAWWAIQQGGLLAYQGALKLGTAAQWAYTAATKGLMALGGAAWWLAQKAALLAYQGVQYAVSAATKLWAAAQWALNVAMDANPIGLIILGIAALIAIVVLCWNKFPAFRHAVQDAMHYGAIAVSWVVDKAKALWGWITQLGSSAGKWLSGMWDGMKDGFKDVVNWLIDKWNWLGSKIGTISIPGTDIKFTPFPTLPHLKAGGTITSPGDVVVGDGGGPEILRNVPAGASVIPLPRYPEFTGGGARCVHNLRIEVDGRELAHTVNEYNDDAVARH